MIGYPTMIGFVFLMLLGFILGYYFLPWILHWIRDHQK